MQFGSMDKEWKMERQTLHGAVPRLAFAKVQPQPSA